MNIAIVGNGVVGSALAAAWATNPGNAILTYDKEKGRSNCILADVLASDLIVICLPTPAGQGEPGRAGLLDISHIDHFFKYIVYPTEKYRSLCFVIKSTVPVGLTDELAKTYQLPNLVHSPEFLTARTNIVDALAPRINVIGRPGSDSGEEGRRVNQAAVRLKALYRSVNPNVPILEMKAVESEAVKLVMNSFFAVKVAFWNEAQELLAKLGPGSFEEVKSAILQEGRVHPLHTRVPGPDGQFGFGGTCLPKDLACFVYQCFQHGLTPSMAASALARNQHDRKRGV